MSAHWMLPFFMGWLLVCGGCAGAPMNPAEADSSPVPRDSLPDERPYVVGGRKDTGNIYLSTVVVGVDGNEDGGCSGVLIAPQLVLTAGHCVCLERPLEAPMGETRTVIDGSVCAREVAVFTKTYGKTVRVDAHQGARVIPHPELKLLYRKNGTLVQGQSDLAIIYLKEPITQVRSVALAQKGVRSGSAVAIVGFGDTSFTQKKLGERYYGNTTVDTVDAELRLQCRAEGPSPLGQRTTLENPRLNPQNRAP